jgi:hypothetical protein
MDRYHGGPKLFITTKPAKAGFVVIKVTTKETFEVSQIRGATRFWKKTYSCTLTDKIVVATK